jgi:tetratricopeptide (TPR) repeat protein
VFLLLALVFGGGFIFFGVGSGNSGLGDLFSGDFGSLFGGGSGPSITKLQKAVAKNPGDADSWLKLAHALEQKGRLDEAVTALETYTALRPKNAAGWQELATQYLTQAQNYYTESIRLQTELAGVPGPGLEVPAGSFLAQEFQKNELYAAVTGALTARIQELQTKLQSTLTQRAGAYKRAADALGAADPSLPSIVFAWARAAEDAQDYPTALKAYQRYLKLAPDSALAADARAAIKRLKAFVKAQQSSSPTTG